MISIRKIVRELFRDARSLFGDGALSFVSILFGLPIIGGFIYALGIPIVQIWGFLKNSRWEEYSAAHVLAEVWPWFENPTDWYGVHKIIFHSVHWLHGSIFVLIFTFLYAYLVSKLPLPEPIQRNWHAESNLNEKKVSFFIVCFTFTSPLVALAVANLFFLGEPSVEERLTAKCEGTKFERSCRRFIEEVVHKNCLGKSTYVTSPITGKSEPVLMHTDFCADGFVTTLSHKYSAGYIFAVPDDVAVSWRVFLSSNNEYICEGLSAAHSMYFGKRNNDVKRFPDYGKLDSNWTVIPLFKSKELCQSSFNGVGH